jgi:hypothetical protein
VVIVPLPALAFGLDARYAIGALVRVHGSRVTKV